MPGTTRYSATFDRPYEEDDRPEPPQAPPPSRRSRSMSLQAPSAPNGRPYVPLLGNGHPPRSSSTDNGPSNGVESIPTRTAAKAAVKAHSNPFQFVKVGTCPLYKKAEEQLKKVKEVKKTEVLKEEEEEWQSNLDSWKSRRRKMSEDVFKRQEEIKQFEMEEQVTQVPQKKTKTFSEMVESRATRGRALSLCLLSSPLEFQDWDPSRKSSKKMNSVDNLFSGGSEENSNVNSEDEVAYQKSDENVQNGNIGSRLNGSGTIHENGSSRNTNHSNSNKLFETSSESIVPKDDQGQLGIYIDSGLESISSHRAGDIPDSGSDFSQDSGGSMDCESPRAMGVTATGVAKLLEEFNSQSLKGQPTLPVHNGLQNGNTSVSSTNGIKQNKEHTNTENSTHVNGTKEKLDERTVNAKVQGAVKENAPKNVIGKSTKLNKISEKNKSQERSIESENEMYVDDFEELNGNVKLLENAKNKSSSVKAKSSTVPKLVNNTQKTTVQNTNGPQHEADCNSSLTDSSLNIIYQSHKEVKNRAVEPQSIKKLPNTNITPKPITKTDVPPVEKVAEEMEKLILEQLEEEERAKEMIAEVRSKEMGTIAENVLITPPRQLEPPKEKPPPPPEATSDTKKGAAVTRVNSTKRIRKEIHKRRSNFLGIENEDENSICDGSSVPPPPALEDILKAEMEIDREGRKQIENAATERLSIEESEILRKEREIIENLEMEERRKLYMGLTEDGADLKQSLVEPRTNTEKDRIQNLKKERKKMEEDRILNEEQRMRLDEERLLRDREEYIRKQEDDKITELSTPLISAATASVKAPKPALTTTTTSLSSTKPNTLLSENGDGKNTISDSLASKCDDVAQAKPIVPPKPLKKKEVIRKERERLRQEQEALQRQKEEHRQKLLLEQELMKNSQKPHAPDAPASRIGPPPPAKPTFATQLTPLSAPPTARENTAYTSRSHHGAQNGILGNANSDAKRLPGQPTSRQNKPVSSRGKAAQNESWGQQKVPSVRKQNDSLTESRYNQNHWLIQEAEMRRIAELNERQSSQVQLDARVSAQKPYSQAHLVEDDVCSKLIASQRLTTVMPSTQGAPSNCVMSPQAGPSEQIWNYGPLHPNAQVVKYPAPLSGEKLHTHVSYPRKQVEAPTKPSRVVPMERQEQMLSVSGRKRCSHCNEELGRGAAMIIESLQLYYHIHCFQCCVCQAQLGNGSCGTDVRVRNNKLHCHNCYSNDEAGLKFSQV